jgi:hypothetical protein
VITLTAYLDFSGANEVVIDIEHTVLEYEARKSFAYRVSTDNGTWDYDAKADRIYTCEGGPISATELTRIKTLTESSSNVNFRSAITSNADVTVTIISYQAEYGRDAVGTEMIRVKIVMREVV